MNDFEEVKKKFTSNKIWEKCKKGPTLEQGSKLSTGQNEKVRPFLESAI